MFDFFRSMGFPIDFLLSSPIAFFLGIWVVWLGVNKKRRSVIVLGSFLLGFGFIHTILWIIYGCPWNR